MELLGKAVIHKKWGTGIIESIAEGRMTVVFSEMRKEFLYPDAFASFLTMEDELEQERIIVEAKASVNDREKQKNNAREKELERIEKKVIQSKENNKSKEYNSPIDHHIWIKFEGPQKENQPHEMVEVNSGGRKIYILNYRKRPAIQEEDEVYLAAGILDDNGMSQQSIVGRGRLHSTSEEEVRQEWIGKYEWMNHYHYYAELIEMEVLDAPRSKGLYLDQVIRTIGSDTFEASYGENRSYEKLRIIHTQKQHMKLTYDAKKYIDEEFDKLVRIFGSKKYYSE